MTRRRREAKPPCTPTPRRDGRTHRRSTCAAVRNRVERGVRRWESEAALSFFPPGDACVGLRLLLLVLVLVLLLGGNQGLVRRRRRTRRSRRTRRARPPPPASKQAARAAAGPRRRSGAPRPPGGPTATGRTGGEKCPRRRPPPPPPRRRAPRFFFPGGGARRVLDRAVVSAFFEPTSNRPRTLRPPSAGASRPRAPRPARRSPPSGPRRRARGPERAAAGRVGRGDAARRVRAPVRSRFERRRRVRARRAHRTLARRAHRTLAPLAPRGRLRPTSRRIYTSGSFTDRAPAARAHSARATPASRPPRTAPLAKTSRAVNETVRSSVRRSSDPDVEVVGRGGATTPSTSRVARYVVFPRSAPSPCRADRRLEDARAARAETSRERVLHSSSAGLRRSCAAARGRAARRGGSRCPGRASRR